MDFLFKKVNTAINNTVIIFKNTLVHFSFLSKQEMLPNISGSLQSAETPFDIAVDFLNFWANVTGVEMIRTRKTDGVLISWDEMNAVWLEIMARLWSVPGVPVFLLRTVWFQLSSGLHCPPRLQSRLRKSSC